MADYGKSVFTSLAGSSNFMIAEPKKRYNTRIAPSPTGHAHIGTFRTAYFCYLAARASGGSFMLRIDDTDTNRNDESAVNPIHEALEWLEMYPDDSIRQSNYTYNYYNIAKDLVNAGLAVVLDNGAIALKWNDEMPREWHDNIAGKMVINDTNIKQIDGKLILCKGKEGKYAPTYQLASTYDDQRYGINYVIRGTDHISNTPKQMALWWALNKITEPQPYPEWAHIGLIFKDGKKLSKRDGAASVLEWRDKGYTPDALKSFMLRLGWAPKVDNKENDLLSYSRAVQMFLTEGKMRNSSANMDVAKLDAYERKTRAGYGKEKCAHIDKMTAQIKENWLIVANRDATISIMDADIDLDDDDQPVPAANPVNVGGVGLAEDFPVFPGDELSQPGWMFINRMKSKTRKKKVAPMPQAGQLYNAAERWPVVDGPAWNGLAIRPIGEPIGARGNLAAQAPIYNPGGLYRAYMEEQRPVRVVAEAAPIIGNLGQQLAQQHLNNLAVQQMAPDRIVRGYEEAADIRYRNIYDYGLGQQAGRPLEQRMADIVEVEPEQGDE